MPRPRHPSNTEAPTERDWYDLPAYYDLVFDGLTVAEAAFIDGLAHRHVSGRRRRILEPACGSGRLLAALARRGYEVAGFDASQPMLDFARQRLASLGLEASLSLQRLEDFRYRRKFDLAHCMVSSFKYVLTEEDARSHLQCVARAVRRGGIYVLGFHLTEYEDQTVDRERWSGQRDGVRVICTIRSEPPQRRSRTESIRSRMSVTEGGKTRRFETHWTFRTYSVGQFRALLRSVPEWKLVATHDFDYDLDRASVMGRDRLDTVAVLKRQ